MNLDTETTARSRRRRAILPGITAGVLLAIVSYPAGRTVITEQLLSLTPWTACYSQWSSVPGHGSAGLDRALEQTAARHPSDARLQVGALLAAHQMSFPSLVPALRVLEAAHPGSVLATAAALNYEVGALNATRTTNAAVTADESAPAHAGRAPAVAPETLLADATRGAALEPDNGYFPFVQAIALLQMYRDADAFRALATAAAAPNFNDHLLDAIAATDAAALRAEPDLLGISRAVIAEAALFPQFAQWRGAARLIRVRINQLDSHGDFVHAMALRMELLHLAAAMRIHSTTMIGGLVAIAISGITEQAPTAYLPPNYHQLDTKARLEAQTSAIRKYFGLHATPADAAWIAQDRADCTAYRLACQKTLEPGSVTQREETQVLTLLVIGDLLMLAALLLAGAAALAAALLPAVNRGARWGLGPVTRYALTGGFSLGALVALASQAGSYQVFWWAAVATVLAAALALPVMSFRNRLSALKVALIPGIATALVGTFLANIAGRGSLLAGFADIYGSDGQAAAHWTAIEVAVAAGPLLLVLAVVAAVTFWCRVPLTLGVVRGVRGVAPVVCCATLLLFAVETVMTLQSNQRLNQSISHNLYHPTTIAQLRAKGIRPGTVPRDPYL
ncbi:MAG: hypothetical protein KGJ62_04275 [Armatimonadetes bacterium]|nr:hypothetical protein [Armatimonadota bacterium]MDE2205698.1 hypothetical protein [Armatimonadota bacterium]